jgi:site-specific DNA-methyltransferase (adenine-specific)
MSEPENELTQHSDLNTQHFERAPRNRTLSLSPEELENYRKRLTRLEQKAAPEEIQGRTLNQDLLEALPLLPDNFIDLLFVDPPYNLDKNFGAVNFKKMGADSYEQWLDSWLSQIRGKLKGTASIYICGDWESSSAIYRVLQRYFKVRNRITWEREKGRGAKANWKNCSEDIWFATVSDKYTFNVEAVKVRRKVIAPYRHENGAPKDWQEEAEGNYRITHPSNLWTDLTVPFWSMPENTDHPTQKPEKLVAKILLASSNEGDFVFDPFLGSGTTSVVAKKLRRRFAGVEIDPDYACLVERRLDLAEQDRSIQGYVNGVFWERNSFKLQKPS